MGHVVRFASLALAAAIVVPAQAQMADSAAAAATAFYGAYLKLMPSGVPDAAQRERMRALLSPALNELLAAADAAEARYAEKTKKQAPPLVQGDLFTSLFEGASQFAVTACAGDAQKAVCPVDLVYRDGKSGPEAKWQDRVHVVKIANGWVVGDVEYGGNWPFARRGRLSDGLKAVVRNADK